MSQMTRGAKVIEIATGRTATIVNVWPHGTDSHAEPWAKIMFGLGEQGVSFCCRDLSELRGEWEQVEPEAPEPEQATGRVAADQFGGYAMNDTYNHCPGCNAKMPRSSTVVLCDDCRHAAEAKRAAVCTCKPGENATLCDAG